MTSAGAAEQEDLLDLVTGAVVVSSTGSYGGHWGELGLVDGTTEVGWCSKRGQAFPNTFVLELAEAYRLERLVVNNEGVQESGYAGISAKEVEIWISSTGPETGFEKIAKIEAPQGKRGEFLLSQVAPGKAAQGQWLKLVVLSNWGREDFTEIMELEAYGKPVGAAPEGRSVTGIYQTNYGLMRLEQSGTRVEGCYDFDGGTLRGSTDGRVVDFEWREDEGTQVGTAILVLTQDAQTLNGLWYEEGKLRGDWQGPRAEKGQEPTCQIGGKGERLGEALEATGRAIVYGIYFDSDRATLKAESEPALQELEGLLRERKTLKVLLEGHTDSMNSDAHNLDLSERRAEAVRQWLVKHGIEASRLTAKGLGESQPVADNASPQGRRLNRRVEVVASP